MIKAVFFDIDGTLVSFKTHEVPPSAIKALHQLQSRGILTFIATGRHILSINNLGSLKFDGYITLNGSYCFAGSKLIYKCSIPATDISTLVSYLEEKENFPCIFVHDHALYINDTNEQTETTFRLLNFPQPPVLPLKEAAQGETFQLIAFFNAAQEKEVMPRLLHCQATRWTSLFSDVIPLGSNKQIGLQKMMEYYGLSREEILAFGDGGNDIPMLQYAGIGVAMGNAKDTVKQSADYVTASVDEDGIYKALIQLDVISEKPSQKQ